MIIRRPLILALLALPGCSLLVKIPEPLPPIANSKSVKPLTNAEKVAYLFSNLGEVCPGVAYRTNDPNRRVLDFLAERVDLGHIVDLMGRPDPEEKAFIEARGGTYTHLRMSAGRPPTPRKILAMIRVTLRAQADSRPLLIHCRAGADRAGVMVAIWRMLFQGVTDRERLKWESLYHFHLKPVYPNVERFIELFPVELFRPFVDNPEWLDDEERVTELETRFFLGYPLLAGSTKIHRGPLRLGVAKENLLDGWTEEVQMASYGPFPGVSTETREPIFVRALFVENDRLRAAIVSCDLLVISLPLRRAVEERLAANGIVLDGLLLSATHTHTSVGAYIDSWIYELYMFGSYRDEVHEQLVTRIASAIQTAAGNVQPARVGAGSTRVSGLTQNRRWSTTNDEEVGIIKFTNSDDQPLAVLVNFTGHPVLEPNDRKISSDYPGLLTRALDERYGFSLFFSGALGDINARRGEGSGENRSAVRAARQLESVVTAAVDDIKTRGDNIALGSMTSYFELPPFNANPIPDLLFPLNWLTSALIDWPENVPLQVVRIDNIALVGTASEIVCELGLEIKRRSQAQHTFVVTHTGAYAGYALEQTDHAKSKLDPSGFVALNGPTHGPKVVKAAVAMTEVLWKGEPRRKIAPREADDDDNAWWPARPTAPIYPQSRRFDHFVLDSFPETLRLDSTFLYLDGLRGGNRAEGHRRELNFQLSSHLPGKFHVDIQGGHARSDWTLGGVRSSEEGLTDLSLGVQRPFLVAADPEEGNALRLIPRAALRAPTGDADEAVPFAFAVGSGVWRPTFGGAVEFTWNTYRVLTIESSYTTALDRHNGRRPGDHWGNTLTYTERHGMVSLTLGLATALQLADVRRGGRRAVDVHETSFELLLRPGASLHLAEFVELFTLGYVPLAHGGSGAGSTEGVMAGIAVGF